MKIMIINSTSEGSTGSISRDLGRFFSSINDNVIFCHAFGSKVNESFPCYKISNTFWKYFSGLLTRIFASRYSSGLLATLRLIHKIKHFKPDVINVHCLNIYSFNLFLLFKYFKKIESKVFITAHAFFYSTGNCGHPLKECNQNFLIGCKKCPNNFYCSKCLFPSTARNWKKMKAAFSQTKFTFIGVSDYVTSITKLSPITMNNNAVTIINGVDTNIYKICAKKLSKSNHLTNIIFVVSDINSKVKGFSYFLELIKSFENDNEYVFYLVGKCDINLPKNVVKCGLIKDKNKLASLYSECDISIMLSKDETFSLPVAESLCCGTPVAFFECGGAESICIEWCSARFKYGDVENLKKYLLEKSYLSFDDKKISKEAHAKYSLDINHKVYRDLFTKKS